MRSGRSDRRQRRLLVPFCHSYRNTTAVNATKKMAPMTTPAHSSNEGSVLVSHFSTVGPWHTETTTHPPPEAGFAGREAH